MIEGFRIQLKTVELQEFLLKRAVAIELTATRAEAKAQQRYDEEKALFDSRYSPPGAPMPHPYAQPQVASMVVGPRVDSNQLKRYAMLCRRTASHIRYSADHLIPNETYVFTHAQLHNGDEVHGMTPAYPQVYGVTHGIVGELGIPNMLDDVEFAV